jgi:hypothetical protein
MTLYGFRMNRNDLFGVSAMGASALFAAVICISFGVPNDTQWVEAWGTIGAILAALFVPLISRNMERADRRADRRAYSKQFAVGLLVPMGLLRADVTRVRNVFSALEQAGAATATRVEQLNFARLRISPSLEAAVPQFATMDPTVVGRVQFVIMHAQSYNGVVEAALEIARNNINDFEAKRAELVSRIVAAINLLEPRLVEVVGVPPNAANSQPASAGPTT